MKGSFFIDPFALSIEICQIMEIIFLLLNYFLKFSFLYTSIDSTLLLLILERQRAFVLQSFHIWSFASYYLFSLFNSSWTSFGRQIMFLWWKMCSSLFLCLMNLSSVALYAWAPLLNQLQQGVATYSVRSASWNH